MARADGAVMPISRQNPVRYFAILLVLSGIVSCSPDRPEPGSLIELAELSARLSSPTAPVILDVRTPVEFAAGHIPGAVNIPHDKLAERLASLKLPSTAEIVVHCKSGRRAALAESLLRASGYTNVRDLRGHMQGWRAGGFPIESQ